MNLVGFTTRLKTILKMKNTINNLRLYITRFNKIIIYVVIIQKPLMIAWFTAFCLVEGLLLFPNSIKFRQKQEIDIIKHSIDATIDNLALKNPTIIPIINIYLL